MSSRNNATAVVANPVLVGAATALVTLVAVFLAYNANSGLPLVPTYDLEVEMPDAGRMTAGNEIRIGGRRVGTVTKVKGVQRGGRVLAQITAEIEQQAGPLPADTRARIRPRSTLGLKYLELTPGRQERMLPDGGTLPVGQADTHVELDQVLGAFDAPTRNNLRIAVKGLSDGLAGRGGDVNAAFGELRPTARRLLPVARTLASSAADLDGFIDALAGATGTLAPVAPSLGRAVPDLDVTAGALDDARPAIDETLVELPPTAGAGARLLPRIAPVVADAAALAEDLRPGVKLLPGAAGGLAGVARRGTPVLRRANRLGPDLEEALTALGRLVERPSTTGAVRRLTGVVARLAPTLEAVNPFQVQCNYLGVWTRNASSAISEGDELGTWFRFIPIYQPTEILQSAEPAPELHNTPYGRVDGECETGNEPFEQGQRIGNPPGLQRNATQDTAPPRGVPVR